MSGGDGGGTAYDRLLTVRAIEAYHDEQDNGGGGGGGGVPGGGPAF